MKEVLRFENVSMHYHSKQGETVAVENIVTQDHGAFVIADELPANQERLGQAVGTGLLGVAQLQAKLAAVAQKLLKTGQVLGGGNNENIPDTCAHQHRNGIVDHRFIINWHQLFANAFGDWVQTCSRTSC